MNLNKVFLLLLLMVSCRKPNTKQVVEDNNSPQLIRLGNQTEFRVFEWEHRGHKYLIIDRSNGSGITHAGHCECNIR